MFYLILNRHDILCVQCHPGSVSRAVHGMLGSCLCVVLHYFKNTSRCMFYFIFGIVHKHYLLWVHTYSCSYFLNNFDNVAMFGIIILKIMQKKYHCHLYNLLEGMEVCSLHLPSSFTYFFIFPLGISTGFEAVHRKSNPAWLVHRGHFHPICGSSQISSLNWRARGCQNCQLHTILSKPHAEFLAENFTAHQNITEWIKAWICWDTEFMWVFQNTRL